MSDELFRPLRPALEVEEFLEKNPMFDLSTALRFLLDRYPQLDDGQPQWIVEGGAAVRLLTHNTNRTVTRDIDIVTRKPDLVAAC